MKNSKDIKIANEQDRDSVYRELLQLLFLNEAHKKDLLNRGFSEKDILRGEYKSIDSTSRKNIIEPLLSKFSKELLLRVPGFYYSNSFKVCFSSQEGMLIPVRGVSGQIAALKVRHYGKEQQNKYTYITSSSRNGPSPGSPIHKPLFDFEKEYEVRITEGELKADIATIKTEILSLSIPGVSNMSSIFSFLESLKAKIVLLAIDTDMFEKRNVSKSFMSIYSKLISEGYNVKIETWDISKAKGIDDALNLGLKIKTLEGLEASDFVEKVCDSAISADPNRQDEKIISARTYVFNMLGKLKKDKSVIYRSDFIKAALILKRLDKKSYVQLRDTIKKKKISLREFNELLKTEQTELEIENYEKSVNGEKYQIKNNCIFWNSKNADGAPVHIRLSNFQAKVETEETVDDGLEKKKYFRITGILSNGTTLPISRVLADQFASMNWVVTEWGSRAIIAAGQGYKDKLREAIQELSEKVSIVTSYSHMGWRKINNKWVYLFHGGAISEDGFTDQYDVDLGDGKLKYYQLPAPPKDEVLANVVRASISILELAPPKITYPLLATIYRAVIGEVLPIDFSVFFVGLTGIGKTQLAALGMSHFGGEFDSKNLPGNWTSTANALEDQAFRVKDGLFVVDDFNPHPTAQGALTMHTSAERLLRAQANRGGRGRLTSDCKQKHERFPRGLILSTGEDLPTGASLRARMLMLDLSKGDVVFGKLTEFQELASKGMFAQALSAYIQWIAKGMSKLKEELPNRHRQIREEFASSDRHKRSADMLASLFVGMETFFQFCTESSVIDKEEASEHLNRLKQVLEQVGEKQSNHHLSEDPASRFIDLIVAAISSGRAHFSDAKTGAAPAEPDKWGWQVCGKVLSERENHPEDTYIQRGNCIGWISDEEVWLEPNSAYATVQKFSKEQGGVLSISQQTLWKYLKERKLITAPEGEQRNISKRTVQDKRRSVLVFPDKEIFLETVPQNPVVPVFNVERGSEKKFKNTQNDCESQQGRRIQ